MKKDLLYRNIIVGLNEAEAQRLQSNVFGSGETAGEVMDRAIEHVINTPKLDRPWKLQQDLLLRKGSKMSKIRQRQYSLKITNDNFVLVHALSEELGWSMSDLVRRIIHNLPEVVVDATVSYNQGLPDSGVIACSTTHLNIKVTLDEFAHLTSWAAGQSKGLCALVAEQIHLAAENDFKGFSGSIRRRLPTRTSEFRQFHCSMDRADYAKLRSTSVKSRWTCASIIRSVLADPLSGRTSPVPVPKPVQVQAPAPAPVRAPAPAPASATVLTPAQMRAPAPVPIPAPAPASTPVLTIAPAPITNVDLMIQRGCERFVARHPQASLTLAHIQAAFFAGADLVRTIIGGDK